MCQEKRQPKSFQSLSHILHVWPNEKLLKKNLKFIAVTVSNSTVMIMTNQNKKKADK